MRSSLLLLLTCCAAVNAAETSTPAHPLAERSDGVLVVDQQRLLAEALLAPPTSLWADPDFARQRAHIEAQLAVLLASEPEAPPLLELLRHGGRSYLAFSLPEPEPDPDFALPLFLAMEVGDAAPALSAWLASAATGSGEADAAAVAGIDGIRIDPEGQALFAAVADGVLTFGPDDLVAAWADAGRPFPDPSPEVAYSRTGFRPLIEALLPMADLDPQLDLGLGLLLGEAWRDAAPSLSARTAVDAEGWRSRIALRGLAELPLRPLGPELVARLPQEPDLLMAAGIDPPELGRQLVGWIALLEERPNDEVAAEFDAQLVARTGLDLAGIVATLTGEVAGAIAWAPDAMPFPKGAVVIGVRDGDAAAAVVSQLLQGTETLAAEVPGAHMAWSLAVPMQQLTIAVAADAVVIANRPDLAAAALAPRADEAVPWAAGSVAHIGIGLRAIGERWLPMGLAQLGMVDEPIGQDPLAGLRNARWQIGQQLIADPPPTTVAEAFFGDQDELEQGWLRGQLARLFADDLDASLERQLAIWRLDDPDLPDAAPEVALVLRSADGFRVLQDWNEVTLVPDAVAARQRLTGYRRALGPVLEELLPTELPQRPRFDRRWLPAAPLAVRHLPPRYVLDLGRDDCAWVVSELGLPLVANYAHSAGMIAAAMAPMLGWRLQELQRLARADALRAEHAAVVAVLERVAPAIGRLHANGDLPAKASHLATGGHLSLDEAAGLFGGEAPATAAELDGVGRWTPEPEGWPQAVWAIQLEPGWMAYVSPWGEVELTDQLPELESEAETEPEPDPAL